MTGQVNIGATLFRTANLRLFSLSLRRWGYRGIVILFAVNLTALTAHAQQLAANDFVLSTKITGSWWSQRTGLADAPRLWPGMASLYHFETSSRKSSNSQQSDPPVQYAGDLIENPAGLEADDASRKGSLSLFAESEPPSAQSFFSSIETRYVTWESNLADTRTLTYANVALVYPLLQLNYERSNLAVTLYVSPLRGTDARK